jgi:hypothetical protein
MARYGIFVDDTRNPFEAEGIAIKARWAMF